MLKNDSYLIKSNTATKRIFNSVTDNWWTKPITIVQGGQGAGKTYGILSTLVALASIEELEIIVCSAELTKMRLTVIKDFVNIMKMLGAFNPNNWKMGTEYTFENGSFIKFIGLDKDDVGKGLRCDVLFINEANKTTYDKVHELISRAKRKIFDYNPNARFWVDEHFKDRPDAQFMVLTYLDNEYLSREEVAEIEAYKTRGFIDPTLEDYDREDNIKSNFWANKWRVYGLGQTGKIDGLIYTDWRTGEFDDTLPYRFGLDFGFSADPDALVKIAVDEKRKKIYLHECFYKSGQNFETLKERLRLYCKPDDLIIADSAEPRLINDLRANFNIQPTIKWRITERIKKMQGYELVVTPSSVNLIAELEGYTWSDKKSETPIDANNHLLDAAGYGLTGMINFEFKIA